MQLVVSNMSGELSDSAATAPERETAVVEMTGKLVEISEQARVRSEVFSDLKTGVEDDGGPGRKVYRLGQRRIEVHEDVEQSEKKRGWNPER